MNKENNETLLTVDELRGIASTLTDVSETIELYNNSFEFVKEPKEVKNYELEYYKVKKIIDTMFNMNQKLMFDLDKVEYLLYENDNLEELKINREKGRL